MRQAATEPTLIDKYHHPNRYKTEEEIAAETKPTLLDLFAEFLVKHKLSEVRIKNFRVVQRALARYELYVKATKRGQKGFILDVDLVTPDTLRDMWDFFQNEYQYYELYPSIYEAQKQEHADRLFFKNTYILPVVLR